MSMLRLAALAHGAKHTGRISRDPLIRQLCKDKIQKPSRPETDRLYWQSEQKAGRIIGSSRNLKRIKMPEHMDMDPVTWTKELLARRAAFPAEHAASEEYKERRDFRKFELIYSKDLEAYEAMVARRMAERARRGLDRHQGQRRSPGTVNNE
ncbi:uncharacterized protein LTR77_002710 [Saxophila tyrrhenica]|uniref:Uncharacterized protein n=1 Tax=Saxophila tyrrhenica TaxID=1690608 RepID=A0AAV9PJU3_9PEZI|nr:hypothetical protein LTR77_002710 [Saxophila tyrrhenica]